MVEDKDLIIMYLNGDENAFNELYKRYLPYRHSLAYKYKNSIQNYDLDDILAELDIAFLQAITKFDTTREDVSFFTFLGCVSTNYINQIYSREKKKIKTIDISKYQEENQNDIDLIVDEDDKILKIENSLDQEILKLKIINFLYSKNIKETNINLFVDFYFNGYNQKQLSAKYNLKVGNIADRLARVKNTIRKETDYDLRG